MQGKKEKHNTEYNKTNQKDNKEKKQTQKNSTTGADASDRQVSLLLANEALKSKVYQFSSEKISISTCIGAQLLASDAVCRQQTHTQTDYSMPPQLRPRHKNYLADVIIICTFISVFRRAVSHHDVNNDSSSPLFTTARVLPCHRIFQSKRSKIELSSFCSCLFGHCGQRQSSRSKLQNDNSIVHRIDNNWYQLAQTVLYSKRTMSLQQVYSN